MNVLTACRWSLLVGIVLFTSDLPAQTNAPAAINPCIVPVPRTDASTNRFQELNQRVKEAGDKAQVIFVGDSITQGWEGNGKEIWAKYYQPRDALNLGIGSDSTQHVLWRLEHGNLDGLKPKVAVVLIGVNNVPPESNTPGMILEGVTAVVQKLRSALPETKVLLLGVFPFRQDFNPQRAKALQVNQALRKLDNGDTVRFLDFGHLFIESNGKISQTMMRDYLHLSPDGYRLWAEAMEPTLAQMLGEPPVRP